jgi:hypothetical protein
MASHCTRETIRVPVSNSMFEVQIIASYKYDGVMPGKFQYLQSIRNDKSAGKSDYEGTLSWNKTLLASAVKGDVDALVSPPSDYAWLTEPYRDKLRRKFPTATDLTDHFSREGSVRASKGATLNEVIDSLTYMPTGSEKEYRRILIIDDTFNRGVTASAILTRLKENGLPESCEVMVLCLLWMPDPSSKR